MTTIILCGGKSERLKFQGEDLPKPLWKIGGKPLLWHIMQHYARFGYRNFICCTGYRHEAFEDFLAHEDLNGIEVKLDFAGTEAGTAQRILHAAAEIKQDRFFCTYGDGLSDVKVSDLLRFHLNSGKLATLTAVRPQLTFGLLGLDENHLVMNFTEKPKLNAWINGGYFVFESGVLPYLSKGTILEQEPLMSMAADHQLQAYLHEGQWQCMDTFKDYQQLQDLSLAGKAFW